MLNANSNPKIRMTTAISTSVNPDVRDRFMAKCPQRDSSARATQAAPARRVVSEWPSAMWRRDLRALGGMAREPSVRRLLRANGAVRNAWRRAMKGSAIAQRRAAGGDADGGAAGYEAGADAAAGGFFGLG